MTRALLLLAASVIFASCLKKSTANQKNWYCEKYDSVVSNIPALSFNGMSVHPEKYDAVNENDIKFIIKKNTRKDTVFFRNDTLVEVYRTMGVRRLSNVGVNLPAKECF